MTFRPTHKCNRKKARGPGSYYRQCKIVDGPRICAYGCVLVRFRNGKTAVVPNRVLRRIAP